MRMIWMATTIGLLTFPGSGNAACAITSGNGMWDVYAAVVTGTPGWNSCSVRVTNGTVTGNCVTDTGINNRVTGKLSVAANCRVSGTLTHTLPNGTKYTATLVQATLGAGNAMIVGAARTSTGQANTFQGIRR